MKKFMVLVLSLGLLLGVTAQALAAAPADMAKNAKQNGQAKHMQFRDTKGHWAEAAIMKVFAKGYVKGYLDGSFQPNKPVSEMEAVKMIVDETNKGDIDANVSNATSSVLKHAAQVPAWGQSYIEEAVESGILTDAELLSFRPNQGAKRIQVALWISRAMDLDERIDTDLDLKFLDKADISTDLYNAVVLVCEAGLMKGNPNNCFLPNKPITRAEMTVLLDRMDGKDADDTLGEYSGTIKAVDDDSITIKHGGWSRTFKFADDMTVKIDGEDADADDLEEGYQVKLVLNDDGKVESIKASTDDEDEDENDDNDTATYEGEIKLIVDSSKNDTISIKTGSITRTFKVDEDTEITVDGDDASLKDLEPGWEAEIEVEDNVALSIKAESDDEDEDADEETEYEGTIDDIDGNEIIIEDEDGNHHTLTVNDDTEITIEEDDEDNDDATIDDLKTGDKVEVKADDDGIALKIEVDRD